MVRALLAVIRWLPGIILGLIVACQQTGQPEQYISILNITHVDGEQYRLTGSPMLVVRFSRDISQSGFSSTLNGVDVTKSFNVLPGGQVLVDLPNLDEAVVNSLAVVAQGEAGEKIYRYSIQYAAKSDISKISSPVGIMDGELAPEAVRELLGQETGNLGPVDSKEL